jgi:cellulose synthase/poly-beta-1,6-N-acetylglucosamine synthase-like glycosyltransferase
VPSKPLTSQPAGRIKAITLVRIVDYFLGDDDMELVLLAASFGVSLFALIFPYLIYPKILAWLPIRPLQPNGLMPESMSLLFCCYNESRALPEKIENMRALRTRYPSVEILAYDDGSSDTSLQLLQAHPKVLTVVLGTGRRGKAHGMKQLAARAQGEILIFSDANVLLDVDGPDLIRGYFADPEVGGVCGALHYTDISATATATVLVGGAYWRLEERIKQLESRSGNVMGADGSIFATRRALYPDFPDTVLDDLTVSMEVVFRGKRLIHAPDVRAYERLVADRNEEYHRKMRIATRALYTHRFLQPRLRKMTAMDRFKYRSHKVIRWAGGVSMAAAVASFLGMMLVISIPLGMAACTVLVGLIIAMLYVRFGPLAKLREILGAILATTIGAMRGLRGQTLATWVPAKSR